MFKKIIAWTLLIALTATAAIGGTVAYLTSEDSDVNVMTLGNVSIEQTENFEQFSDLYPGVSVAKEVTVTNDGSWPAYVRTVVAVEIGDMDKSFLAIEWDITPTEIGVAEFNNSKYILYVVYNDELDAGSSYTALKSVGLTAAADNEQVEAIDGNNNGKFEVLVVSQAVQTGGFNSAEEALNAGFYAITTTSHPWVDAEIKLPTLVCTEDEMKEALKTGARIIVGADISLESAVTVNEEVFIDLNGHTLSTVGLDLTKGGAIENGTITSAAHTYLTPHLKISGGTFKMNGVTVDVEHVLNQNASWTEAAGMEVANATAELNNCNIKIHNSVGAQWVYSYGISMNNADVTVNGGTVTATCVSGTAANGPTNPNAISSMGACNVTLNNVGVSATYYCTTVNGHLNINTTDKNVTDANIVDNRGGSHTLNYIN